MTDSEDGLMRVVVIVDDRTTGLGALVNGGTLPFS